MSKIFQLVSVTPFEMVWIKRLNIKISHNTALASAESFFERIAKHKYKQRTLKKLDSKSLLEMWANAQILPSDDTRKMVNQNLSHYVRKKLNIHAIRNPCIKIPYDNKVDMKQIRHVAEVIFNATDYGTHQRLSQEKTSYSFS